MSSVAPVVLNSFPLHSRLTDARYFLLSCPLFFVFYTWCHLTTFHCWSPCCSLRPVPPPLPALPPRCSPRAWRRRISCSLQQGYAWNEAFVFVLWAGAVQNWIGCSLLARFLLPSSSQTRPVLSPLSPHIPSRSATHCVYQYAFLFFERMLALQGVRHSHCSFI